jgi:hypothetical protein
MKPRHAFMFIALVTAAWLAFFADKSRNNDLSEPTRVASTNQLKATQLTSIKNMQTTSSILPLVERERLINNNDSNKGNKTHIFSAQTWLVPPAPAKVVSIPAPPPTAPPLAFVYLGKTLQGQIWEVYLARGDQTLVVRENTVIDDTYRVDQIKPPHLTLTYLPLQQVQTLPIGASD